jgi:hypothetical protein
MATRLNKRGNTESVGNISGLVIILAIAAVIIFYVVSVTPAERAELGISGYSRVALDTAPGEIIGQAGAEIITFERKLLSFDLKNTPEEESKKLSSSLSVSRSISENNFADFDFTADLEKISEAEIKFKIADKYGSGALVISLNGDRIATTNGKIGDEITAIIPVNKLQAENVINFEVTSPGLAFWQSNSYLIKDIKLILQSYDSTSFTHDFILTTSELSNVGSAKLTAYAKNNGENVPVKILLNNVEIYNGQPNTNFELEIPTQHFDTNNKLVWMAERNGDYSISFPKLDFTLSVLNTEKVLKFNIASIEADAIKSKIYVTKLTLLRHENSYGELVVKVNGNRLKTQFDSKGLYSVDISDYVIAGTNSISLSSDNDIAITRLQVAVKEQQ